MKLRKLDIRFIHDMPADLKGACVLLHGPLNAKVELNELPKELASNLPAIIVCAGCDVYLERLLNERGVGVVSAKDPVDAIPDDTEVEIDLVAGALTELSSGRRFALHPLQPNHLQFIRNHG